MQTTVIGTKDSLEGINSRLDDTEKRASQQEDRDVEIFDAEQKNKERMKIFEVFQFPSHVIKINKIREMSFSYFSSPKLFPQFILKYKYIF